MRKTMPGIVFMVGCILWILESTALSSSYDPVVAIDPTGGQAVRLAVSDNYQDFAWISLPFDPIIMPGDHEVITVSFDVYRQASPGDSASEWFYWSWNSDLVPGYGGQYDFRPTGGQTMTCPFVGIPGGSNIAETVYNRYTNVTLQWDFADTSTHPNGAVHSWFDGSQIDINYPLSDPGTGFWGFTFGLVNSSPPGSGDDVAWIDNFVITGSDIYHSNGFEHFELGLLKGQEGWDASASTVPIPGALVLLGSGLIGLLGLKKRRK